MFSAQAAEPVTRRGHVASLEFTSDHNLICKNTEDIQKSGERYPDVEWVHSPRRNAPITHTGADSSCIKAKIRLALEDVPTETPFLLKGTSDEPALCFRHEGRLTADKEAMVAMEASKPLGRAVRKIKQKIAWRLTLRPGTDTAETLYLGETGPHVVYVTLGTPKNTDDPLSVVTDVRMELAVERVAAAQKKVGMSASSPRLVHELMKQNGDYYVPSRDYRGKSAWKVPETWQMQPKGASCVSIADFVGLVCKMVGLEGTVRTTAYYA